MNRTKWVMKNTFGLTNGQLVVLRKHLNKSKKEIYDLSGQINDLKKEEDDHCFIGGLITGSTYCSPEHSSAI